MGFEGSACNNSTNLVILIPILCLKKPEQALEEALSQPMLSFVLQRAFYVVDMAQVHARKGEVESACNHAKQIISYSRYQCLNTATNY